MIISPSHRFIVHIDMNAYFASVEQQAHPEWRGRPLCVCAYLREYGCVIAASREAKKLGIDVGTRVHDARILAPEAIFVGCEPAKYRSVTRRIFKIFHDYTDRVEYYSIDEAFLDLTGWYKDEIHLIQALCKIKSRIRDEVGEWLTASMGVGPNKLLAKLASDYQKPDGLTIINQNNLDDFLAEHTLQDIVGVGRRTERRLWKAGIFTPIELKRASPAHLLRLYGKMVYFVSAALNGLSVDEVRPYAPSVSKSIGHSYCVPKSVLEQGSALSVFMKLVDKTVRRLHKLQVTAGGVLVAINVGKNIDGKPMSVFERYAHSLQGRERFSEPMHDLFSITKSAVRIFEKLWGGGTPLSFMAISLWGLQPRTHQSSIEVLNLPERRLERLSAALDSIRDKYGEESLMSAALLKAQGEAPERIGFRKIE